MSEPAIYLLLVVLGVPATLCLLPLLLLFAAAGVSVGYFDTEDAAARAYDRAAIGLLGRQNCKAVLNFPIEEYDNDSVPVLVGKSQYCTTAAAVPWHAAIGSFRQCLSADICVRE